MRRTAIVAAVAALALVPAVAQAATTDDPISFPPGQLLPMRLDVAVKLTTGGSIVNMTVKPIATGNQGFSNNVNVVACAGATACRTASINVRRPNPQAVFNFNLQDTSGPIKVGTQVVACTLGFRCTTFSRVLTAR